MKSIDLTPLYRNSIGFDRMAALIDSAMKADASGSSHPAYNIEIIDEDRYAITLDVAGSKESNIDIKVENGVLTIHGADQSDTEKTYLYQGINDRAFESKFNLADHVEVSGAELVNGLLTVYLKKEIPEALKPRTIPINSDESVIDHKSSSKSGKQKSAA